MLDKLWEISALTNDESYQTSLDNNQMTVDAQNNMTQLDNYYNQSSISQFWYWMYPLTLKINLYSLQV